MGRFHLRPYHLRLFLSNRYTSAEVIERATGRVVARASTMERAAKRALADVGASTSDRVASAHVGKLLAERAAANNVPAVHVPKTPGLGYGRARVGRLVDALRAGGVGLV